MELKIGDRVYLPYQGTIQSIHESGALDVKIEDESSPANGAVTHVQPGNISMTAPTPAETAASSRQHIQLGEYTTVTRG